VVTRTAVGMSIYRMANRILTESEFSLEGLKERHHYEFWVVARTAVDIY
jgi:hypothetical protein